MNKKLLSCFMSINIILVLALLGVLLASSGTISWFSLFNTNNLNNNNNEIVAISHGSGSIISSFMNDEEFDPETVNSLYQENQLQLEDTFIPGDVIYYSFIIKLNYDELSGSNAPSINISLTMNAGRRSTYDALYSFLIGDTSYNTGNYNQFLSNLTIEQNTIQMAMLTIADEKYRIINNGTEQAPSYFFDATTSPSITNSSVASFYQNNTMGASFDCSLPSISNANYSQIDGDTYILLLVPIWYKDTGTIQNQEMDSRLQISSCDVNFN